MALEKACEVGLVREIQLLGYGSHCLVRIAEQDFHLGHQLFFYQLLRRAAFKAGGSGTVKISGRDAQFPCIER